MERILIGHENSLCQNVWSKNKSAVTLGASSFKNCLEMHDMTVEKIAAYRLKFL